MNEPQSALEPLEALADEFAERYRRGERPALSEYVGRYPDLAEQIRELFPALVVMEELGSVAESRGGSGPGVDLPAQLGDYQILRVVGRGGMGVVYEAVQKSLGRRVALKILPAPAFLPPSQRERFRREARAAAGLHHTNIVPVYGVGEDQGIHYYAMQFIEGKALDQVGTELRSEPHFFRRIADMGVQVADALEYAHKQGILHRDIKPANLLLDGHGTVWVTDFGLAKAEGADELTHTGDIVGTLRYMAPERFSGQSDARSDVYALGITLYEMLTRQPAFGESHRPRVIERVLHEDPVRPRTLDSHIPRDLETIVLKAIEKEPSRRFQTAAELAEDLRHYLAGEPVRARRAGLGERAAKWARRRPAVAALLAVVAAALITLVTGSLVYSARLEKALATAEANLDKARRAERERTEQLGLSYLRQAQVTRQTGRVGQRFESLEALQKAADSFRALGTFPEHLLDSRNEAIACLILADLGPAQETTLERPWTRFLTFDAARELYAIGDDDDKGVQKWISLRRIADHREVARLSGPDVYAHAAQLSPDGKYLSALYHPALQWALGQLWVWDLDQCKPVLKLNVGAGRGSDFSPDSRRIAVTLNDGSVRVLALPAGSEESRLPSSVRSGGLRFHPDGQKLAVIAEGEPEVTIVDAQHGLVLATLAHPKNLLDLAWRNDGRLLATGCQDHAAYVWDLTNLAQPRLLQTLKGHQEQLFSLRFSHAGELLATAAWDGTSRLWNPLTGQQLVATDQGTFGGFSADDRLLAFKHGREKFGFWKLALGSERRTFRGNVGSLWSAEIGPDGRLMVSAGDDGIRFWDLAAATEADAEIQSLHQAGPSRAALFHGNDLITAGRAGLKRWPILGDFTHGGIRLGPPQTIARSDDGPLSITERTTLSPDGKRIAIVPTRGEALVYAFANPASPLRLTGQPGLHCVSFSPDGNWLATGNWQGSGVKIWNALNGSVVKEWPCNSAKATFSPDGRWLVISTGQEYQFVEVGTWQVLRRLAREKAGDMPGNVVFTRDGAMLAVGHSRTLVRLIDAATCAQLATIPAGGQPLCFSPDGRWLATHGENHAIDLWDLRLIRQQLAALGLDWDG